MLINHNLLLKKLSVYGASPDSVAWFRSYLEEQRRFVKLGHITSEPKPVRQGVPQGSILGPVLFLLFVNDMPLHLNNSTIDIYADDTTLSLSANWNNITSLTQALSNGLENIEKWPAENKMYINTVKTKALLVTGKRLKHKLSEETASLKLRLDATNIYQLSHHKLLSLIIDKDLSFADTKYCVWDLKKCLNYHKFSNSQAVRGRYLYRSFFFSDHFIKQIDCHGSVQ